MKSNADSLGLKDHASNRESLRRAKSTNFSSDKRYINLYY